MVDGDDPLKKRRSPCYWCPGSLVLFSGTSRQYVILFVAFGLLRKDDGTLPLKGVAS